MRLHPCTLSSALNTSARESDSLPPCCLATGAGGNVPLAGQTADTAPALRKTRSGWARDAKALSVERQAERLSDVVGQAQPPLTAVLRAAARTHFVAKSAPLGTPSRAFLGDTPLLLSSEREPLRWVPVRVRRGKRKAEGGKNL